MDAGSEQVEHVEHVVRCLDCGQRIPQAEQDAASGHAPREPRCYECGRKHALGF